MSSQVQLSCGLHRCPAYSSRSAGVRCHDAASRSAVLSDHRVRRFAHSHTAPVSGRCAQRQPEDLERRAVQTGFRQVPGQHMQRHMFSLHAITWACGICGGRRSLQTIPCRRDCQSRRQAVCCRAAASGAHYAPFKAEKPAPSMLFPNS